MFFLRSSAESALDESKPINQDIMDSNADKETTQIKFLLNQQIACYYWKTNNSHKAYFFINFENSVKENMIVDEKYLKKVEELNNNKDRFNILYVCEESNKKRYFFTEDFTENIKKPNHVCVELKFNKQLKTFDQPIDLKVPQEKIINKEGCLSSYLDKATGCLEKVFLSRRDKKESLLENLKNSMNYALKTNRDRDISFTAIHADPEDLFSAWVNLCHENPLPTLLNKRFCFSFFESGDTESIKVVKQVFATLYGINGFDFINNKIKESLKISKSVDQQVKKAA